MGRWLLVSIILVLAVAAAIIGKQALIFLLSGLLTGYVLQRSGFCFLGAINDWLFLRQGAGIRAIIVLLAISIPGFAVMQYLLQQNGQYFGNISPVQPGTLLGGFIFGVGMVLAGGCILNTLARAGEGYGLAWIAIAGIILGSIFGAWNYGFWQDWIGYVVFLPDLIGFKASVALQLLVLAIIWFVIRRREVGARRADRGNN